MHEPQLTAGRRPRGLEFDAGLNPVTRRHGRDKRITPSGHIHHICDTRIAIGKRFTQCDEMKAKAPFFDDRIAPYFCEKIARADDASGTTHERNQNVERATTQLDLLAMTNKQSFIRKQEKRPERKVRRN
jgi:hypothetical protein